MNTTTQTLREPHTCRKASTQGAMRDYRDEHGVWPGWMAIRSCGCCKCFATSADMLAWGDADSEFSKNGVKHWSRWYL